MESAVAFEGIGQMGKLARRFVILTLTVMVLAFSFVGITKQPRRAAFAGPAAFCIGAGSIACRPSL